MNFIVQLRCIIFLLIFCKSECFLEWLFGSENRISEEKKEGSEVGALVKIPFELTVADEKFLAEAQEYGLQTSELDTCYHKVIIKVQSCQNMNEEDIGKLSVRLLNCQSAVEGRQIFQCTDGMTLRECTKNMDQTTWNAYQIVSNRARAICYAARQQQFSAKTEMSVNKLVSTTEYQLNAMKIIQTHQERVGRLTQQTLNAMALGQQDLLQQQERLKLSQNSIHNFVTGNMREILREKALIAAGQKELADMTTDIKKKLDDASHHLHTNEEERLANHQEILADLATIQFKAKEVWEKIENSTQKLLQQHTQASENYKETLHNLHLINETISHMMQVIEQVRTEISLKLGWLGKLLDGTGDQLVLLNTCILHLAYFILAAISAVFIHAPYLSRILLLLLVPLNAFLEINNGKFLDFFSLTAIIIFTTAAQWIFSIIYEFSKKKKIIPSITGIPESSKSSGSPQQQNVVSPNTSYTDDSSDLDYNNDNERSTDAANYSLPIHENNLASHFTPIHNYLSRNSINKHLYSDESLLNIKNRSINNIKRDLSLDLDNDSVRSSHSSTPMRSSSRASTPSRRTCFGHNKSGESCKRSCLKGRNFCYQHLEKYENES